jgi:tRNA(adenine34) deaminase
MTEDEIFMTEALLLAQEAINNGEVPVGAVVVHDGKIIGRGRNAPIGLHDPSGHAEMIAIRESAKTLKNYRLVDCTLYVTLEPCAMCAGAIMHARIKRLVFGARDPKTGVCGSVLNLMENPKLNHHTEVIGGVLKDKAADLLSNFFKSRRDLRKSPIKKS